MVDNAVLIERAQAGEKEARKVLIEEYILCECCSFIACFCCCLNVTEITGYTGDNINTGFFI